MKSNMKKKIALVAAAALVMTTGCIARGRMNYDNGKLIEQTREMPPYTAISTMNGIDVIFSDQVQAGRIIVVAEEAVQGRITTEVEGGELQIRLRPALHWPVYNKMKVIVPNTGNITSLTASGGSDIQAEQVMLRSKELSVECSGGSDFKGRITVDRLDVNCSGGADFKGEVTAGTCRMSASGGSDLKLTGSAKKCDITISGGSDLHAERFAVEIYNLVASGGSDATVFCFGYLTASASGGSDIRYSGDCRTDISDDISSSVKMKR